MVHPPCKWNRKGRGSSHCTTSEPDSVPNITAMLNLGPSDCNDIRLSDFAKEQQKDNDVLEINDFLKDGKLHCDQQQVKKVALQGNTFTIIDDILYYIDVKNGIRKRAVVPKQLQNRIGGEPQWSYGRTLCCTKMYGALCRSWWWEGMYTDVYQYCHNCLQCAISGGAGGNKSLPYIPYQSREHFKS